MCVLRTGATDCVGPARYQTTLQRVEFPSTYSRISHFPSYVDSFRLRKGTYIEYRYSCCNHDGFFSAETVPIFQCFQVSKQFFGQIQPS